MSVPHVLLRLLLEGPSHGYDLRQKLSAFHHFYPLSNVNVYPALRTLEDQRLVSSRREIARSRVRKVYEITEQGIAELESWIAVAPDASVAEEKDLVALKLLLAPNAGALSVGWLERTLAELDAEIERTRAFVEVQRLGDVSPLSLLTAQYRLRSYEQRRDYLSEALRIANEEAKRPDSAVRAKRILVVDDSIAARAFSRHLLSAAGYEVSLAEDGAQAWELLQESEFDAVVSDAIMPEIDGFELLRRMRKDSHLAKLPVIMNTVLDATDERETALALGADDFVCKTDEDSGQSLVDKIHRLTD